MPDSSTPANVIVPIDWPGRAARSVALFATH